MSSPKISKLDWQIIFFVAVSFIILQLHEFYRGVYSSAPMFSYMSGDVQWWVALLSYKIEIVWLLMFGVFLLVKHGYIKQACMLFAYSFSAYKDIYDWVANGNRHTKYLDWIITILLWIFIETIFWGAKKIRSWK